ncbi:tetratricopeptide repeat protein [Williamwhitmania taraxaci]|uniref:Uncharacterized protein n=1 Tax=Williamwhitmania taraxaci TaxID=1640674 RepID=A0A1G6L5Z1_9BACT|nr:hypothetical protein [Williamwhitmania taraxaci]SDC38558.1 hypothetical protein SAMN05216323_102910 [Williamwhitmania taraxaci]
MKTNKLISILLVALILPALAFAQSNIKDPKDLKYGTDSVKRIECLKNLSLYGELFKQDNFKDAKRPWAKVFTNCPMASQNTYINGAKIFKSLIENETDQVTKAHYLDTLMRVYDKRIEFFGRKGYVLGRKALDFVKYAPDSLVTAYAMFNESIDLLKGKSEEQVIGTRYQIAKQLYDQKIVTAEQMLNMYVQSAEYLDAQIAAKPEDKGIQNAKESVEFIFATSGVATCENLVAIFGPKFKANPENLDQTKKISSLLSNANCKDQLFIDVSENIYKKEPSAEAAFNIARMFEAKGDNEKAVTYYKEAINKQANATEKSKYYLVLSNLYNHGLNDKPAAKAAAYNAIESDGTNGMAYMVLGNIYASVRNCGDTDFAKQTIFWLAVDKYTKAKQIDPSLAEDANKSIATYSQYFPKKEEIFFQGLTNGQAVTIGCWINETTYVR